PPAIGGNTTCTGYGSALTIWLTRTWKPPSRRGMGDLTGLCGGAMLKVMKAKPKRRTAEIELHPDAWDRFTEFVKRIAKAGPQHRTKKEVPSGPKKRSKPYRGKTQPRER